MTAVVVPTVDDVIACHTCKGRGRVAHTAEQIVTVTPIECDLRNHRGPAAVSPDTVLCPHCGGYDVERVGRAVFAPSGVRVVRRR